MPSIFNLSEKSLTILAGSDTFTLRGDDIAQLVIENTPKTADGAENSRPWALWIVLKDGKRLLFSRRTSSERVKSIAQNLSEGLGGIAIKEPKSSTLA